MSGKELGKKLAKAATALDQAIEAFEAAGLDPMELLAAVRGPLEQTDDAIARMRTLRKAAVLAAYTDRRIPVFQIAEAAGFSASLVTREATQAGLEPRNRRS
ncbi:hypothetical protein ACIRBX_24980 [Kitasatospora sp. NPDC096147]|uniref:hypothetical protein n=1 Tax=Kitasatospora sp. NPDC096147 TaxID=3364093 RepID=UPI00380E947C